MFGAFILTLPFADDLLFGRALDGVMTGNISVANAYLADITSEKKRNKISEDVSFRPGIYC